MKVALIQIGAFSAVNRNWERARAAELNKIDFYLDPRKVEVLMDKLGMTASELKKLGQDALRSGCAFPKPARTRQFQNETFRLYPPITTQSTNVEGTLVPETASHYLVSTTTSDRRHALDTVIWLAMQMKAWRLQMDIECPSEEHRLSKIVRNFKTVCQRFDWEHMSSENRQLNRDVFAYDISQTIHNWTFQTVFECLLEGLPQASYCEHTVFRCCGDQYSYEAPRDLGCRTGIVIDTKNKCDGSDISTYINAWFQNQFVITSDCATPDSRCQRQATMTRLVLDRLPFTLICHVTDVTTSALRKALRVRATTKRFQENSQEYELTGVVFKTSSAEDGDPRYYARWFSEKNSYIEFDGATKHPSVRETKGRKAWRDVSSEYRVCTIVYRGSRKDLTSTTNVTIEPSLSERNFA